MLIFFGWVQPVTWLGAKLDQCTSCAVVGRHLLARRTWWIHLFYLPVAPVRFQHGMICEACGAWTGIPFLRMRAGMQRRQLPLDRLRPATQQLRDQWLADTGRMPTTADLFDQVVVFPKRGFWDAYLKVWPTVVVLFIVLIALNPR